MIKPLSPNDPVLAEQLAIVQAKRQAYRRTRLYRSRLDRHRAEIEIHIEQGASVRDVVVWLAEFKRMRVAPSTVSRRLKIWAERSSRQNPTHGA